MKIMIYVVLSILYSIICSFIITKVFASSKINGQHTRLVEARIMWAWTIMNFIILLYLSVTGYFQENFLILIFLIIAFIVYIFIAYYYNKYELLITKDKIVLNAPFGKSEIITHENMLGYAHVKYRGSKYYLFKINKDGKTKNISIYNNKMSIYKFIYKDKFIYE